MLSHASTVGESHRGEAAQELKSRPPMVFLRSDVLVRLCSSLGGTMAALTCPHCGSYDEDPGRSGPVPQASTNGVLSSEWSRVGIRIAQASGMVAAQTDCSPDIALQLMKERAEASGISLRDIAVAVLERRTRFA